jgi:methionyl-tRNA formyltransferase
VVETPQIDAEATYAPRLTKEEGLIDWRRPAIEVHNHVRGMRPWPAAFTFLNGHRLVIHATKRLGADAGGAPAGTCVSAGAGGMTVACGDGLAVEVLHVQPEGRRVMSARDFAAGHGRLTGKIFG